MLLSTKAFILKIIKYTHSSIIIQVYTNTNGRDAFMIRSINAKNKKNIRPILQPLYFIEIDYDNKNNNQLKLAKNVSLINYYPNITNNVIKSSIVIFLAEVLQKTLQEENKNNHLFEYIQTSLEILNNDNFDSLNFHISFLIQLSKYLGVYPSNNYKENITPYFDLQSGSFMQNKPLHDNYLDSPITRMFHLFLNTDIIKSEQLKLTGKERSLILNKIIQYYSLHFNTFNSIKSLNILHEIFN